MNETNKRFASDADLSASAPALAFPLLLIDDEGCVCLGSQTPVSRTSDVTDTGIVRLGGQAPMFLPDAIADAGLVRLGGRRPAF